LSFTVTVSPHWVTISNAIAAAALVALAVFTY
jgi:hypothetical protein